MYNCKIGTTKVLSAVQNLTLIGLYLGVSVPKTVKLANFLAQFWQNFCGLCKAFFCVCVQIWGIAVCHSVEKCCNVNALE